MPDDIAHNVTQAVNGALKRLKIETEIPFDAADGPRRFGGMIDTALKNRMRNTHIFKFGVYTLNMRDLTWHDGGKTPAVMLTEKESDILKYLIACGGAVSRKDLLDHVWGYADGVETHTLETHIYRLRQKIERDPTTPQTLVTNDSGYQLYSL